MYKDYDNHYVFNMAADHAINLLLEEDGFSFTSGLEGALKDSKYQNWSIQQIYEDILKQTPNSQQATSTQQKEKTDSIWGSDIIPMSDEEQTQNSVKYAMNVMQSTQAYTKKCQSSSLPGNLPNDLILLLDKFTKTKVNWVTSLNKFLTSYSNRDYSYKRQSRKSQCNLPQRGLNLCDPALGNVNIYWDVSGSVADHEISQMNAEVTKIKEVYNPDNLSVICFDTEISSEYSVTNEEKYQITQEAELVYIKYMNISTRPIQKYQLFLQIYKLLFLLLVQKLS
jgi:predicted metal-dependent peptidase